MHTVESDGSGTVDDVKTAALHNGVDAVIVTNHAKMLTLDEWAVPQPPARELSGNGFLMINAFEVTGSEGLFLRDHVLAWDVADPFVGRDSDELAPEEVWQSPANPAGTGTLHPENIRKWVRYIHRQGGIAVHAHTDGSTDPSYGVDYIEVFNLSHVKDVANYATMMGFPADQAWGLGLTLNNMAIYGERDLSMQVMLPGVPTPLPLRDALFAATKQMTGVGQVLGAPEAAAALVGRAADGVRPTASWIIPPSASRTATRTTRRTSQPEGDYSDVGESRNGVLVRRLTRDGLFDAIKAGRCFATTGPSMEFTVDGRQMGETVKMRTRRSARAEARALRGRREPDAVIAKVTIVKNGEVLRSLSPMTSSMDTSIRDCVDEDGYYRVEVVSVDTATGQYQFAYSNPVFVEMAGSRCGH